MSARPLVGVQSGDAKTKSDQTARLPAVFHTPIRPDLINHVHTRVAKNHRQPYAVSKYAGHDSSAESWGTGRAVARIPRVAGGGTHRAGQGAFGNMCRGGRRFAPTKVWRRWHRKVNVNEKRYAVASAVAASAVPALVMARGHRIDQVAEIPLVVDNKAIDNVDKTSKALALLKALNAHADVQKVKDSHHVRAGVGKMRNRRYVQRRGPLVVYSENGPVLKALRNIAGVDVCNVNRLNILKLAPGGHVGRFIIWTKDAFEKLNSVFGTTSAVSSTKKGYKLPRAIITNADLGRLINSDEIHSVIRAKRQSKKVERKLNPLVNGKAMSRLNPLAVGLRRRALKIQEAREVKKAELLEAKRKGVKPTPVDAKKKAARKAAKKSAKAYGKKITARVFAK